MEKTLVVAVALTLAGCGLAKMVSPEASAVSFPPPVDLEAQHKENEQTFKQALWQCVNARPHPEKYDPVKFTQCENEAFSKITAPEIVDTPYYRKFLLDREEVALRCKEKKVSPDEMLLQQKRALSALQDSVGAENNRRAAAQASQMQQEAQLRKERQRVFIGAMMGSGQPAYQPQPYIIQPSRRTNINCTSNQVGNQVYTSCN